MTSVNDRLFLEDFKKIIQQDVFVTKNDQRIISRRGTESSWIFDFRRVLMKAHVLNLFAESFWQHFGARKLQVGGLEVAAIPAIAAILMKSNEKQNPINGFFIRKSRKKDGLTKMIEGDIGDEPIVLVDDIINTGKSFIRQIEVLESLGKKVESIFVALRFRDLDYYEYFHKKKINIISLVTLDDLNHVLPVKNIINKAAKPTPMPFKVEWIFKSADPSYHFVMPKSAPVIDNERIYFGSDNGTFWSLNQLDGSIAWQYKTGFNRRKKSLFSSPALHKDTVYFGSYDGNFYALEKSTGRKKWIFLEADWIGSSPCIAEDLGLVFVGLEFGLWGKKGGIVALDATTGEKKWAHFISHMVHSSPKYLKNNRTVVVGGNDGVLRAFEAESGKPVWTYKTEGPIKEAPAFNENYAMVAVGSFDSYIHLVDAVSGTRIHAIKTNEAIYSAPLFYNGLLYAASLDKQLYCINPKNGTIIWKFGTNGRIFSSPEMIAGHIYIGSNDGRLYELDPLTAENTGFFQATERITNRIAHNPASKRLFLPTFANEIYCLSRKT